MFSRGKAMLDRVRDRAYRAVPEQWALSGFPGWFGGWLTLAGLILAAGVVPRSFAASSYPQWTLRAFGALLAASCVAALWGASPKGHRDLERLGLRVLVAVCLADIGIVLGYVGLRGIITIALLGAVSCTAIHRLAYLRRADARQRTVIRQMGPPS